MSTTTAQDLTVNGRVSARLQVPPLQEDQIVIYRLIKADQDDITRTEESSGKKLKHQQVYAFVGRKTIWDPGHNKKIVIENITRYKPELLPSGEIKELPVIERIKFPRTGEIILTVRDYEQMQFMERMNENRDNPYRDSSTPARFYRVNSKRQLMKEIEEGDLKTDALVWVRDAAEGELQKIYQGLDAGTKNEVNADSGYEQLKRDIRKIAEKNPILVLKASSNKQAKVKVQIVDAEKFRIIVFDEGDAETPRGWVYIEKSPERICELEPGKNKYDGLIEFFLKNEKGREWYTKIATSLKETLVIRK